MVSKSQASLFHYGQELHYTGRHDCTRTIGPRGGVSENITRVRVSGKCQTWKTRPEDFRVPVKYGLYESGAVDRFNADCFHVPFDCPIRQEEIREEEAAARALANESQPMESLRLNRR